MREIAERIRQEARKLLDDGTVDVVIGYKRAGSDTVATPCFLTDASQVDELVFHKGCTHNLAKYLVGVEGYLTSRFKAEGERPRVAVVALPATMRAIVGLIQEHQMQREDLTILGLVNGAPLGLEPDIVVGEISEDDLRRAQTDELIQELEAMSATERRDWWDREFSKCVRCYACRQVCPFCYCEQCVADENLPQWIEKSTSLPNNRVWNTIRAFHLVGRCINCGECERVCPVGIPLNAINTRISAALEDGFGYVAGVDADLPPALLTFSADDPENLPR